MSSKILQKYLYFSTLKSNIISIYINVVIYSSAIDSRMYAAENRTTVPVEVEFSVKKSQNIAYNTESHTVKKVIQPNRIEILMHVKKDKLSLPLNFDYSFKHTIASE